MRGYQVVFCLLLLAKVSQAQIRPASTEHKECMPVDEVPMCAKIGYHNITFPNFNRQDSPTEANLQLDDYKPLINSKCSNALVYLLCSVYAPHCYSTKVKNRDIKNALPPCRNLCVYVSNGCSEIMKTYGFTWPPGPHLNCSNYPEYKEGHHNLCFGPSDPSILPVFEIPTTREETNCNIRANVTGTTSTLLTVVNITSNMSLADATLICSPPVSNITQKDDSSSYELQGLSPNTEYSCAIGQSGSSGAEDSEAELCNVQFRTHPPLEIRLINDTPHVENGSIRLNLTTNRHVLTLECHLLETKEKLDGSSGSVEFTGLSPGFYAIRILAENNKGDRTVIRVRVRVPDGPDHCVVNLINQQWVIDRGSVTIWFKSSGPVRNIQCKLPNKTTNCNSPLNVALEEGENKIRLIPKGPRCAKKSPRTITITV